jgi:hypothetical protein
VVPRSGRQHSRTPSGLRQHCSRSERSWLLLSAGSGRSLIVGAKRARARVIAKRGIGVRRSRCWTLRRVGASTVHLGRECWEMICQSAPPPKARHHAVHAPALYLHPRSCSGLQGLTRTAYPTRWSAAVSAPARWCIGRLRATVIQGGICRWVTLPDHRGGHPPGTETSPAPQGPRSVTTQSGPFSGGEQSP